MCGGSRFCGHESIHLCGLSPRVRGKPKRAQIAASTIGSIPACAGEAGAGRPTGRVGRVYPRVCGGSSGVACPQCGLAGLSPRVRGKLPDDRGAIFAVGSIPACAGEAGVAWRRWCCNKVYPRVCGGSGYLLVHAALQQGLSPRVRGKPAPTPQEPGQPGSIPACAGEAPPRYTPTSRPTVYPRVCGGSHSGRSRDRILMGLSPRVRGKLWCSSAF